MPIDNFNGFNSTSKELGFVVHTDEVLERGNQLFFTKSRVLAVLSEFFEVSENSEISLKLTKVTLDPVTQEIVCDAPVIVGDFPSLEEDLADGTYIISASINSISQSKIKPGEANTVLVTDSEGKVVWRESQNFTTISPDDIQPGFKNTIMITNNERATQWVRFSKPNSILFANKDGILSVIDSTEEDAIMIVKNGELVFSTEYHPKELLIEKLEVGTKNSILMTNKQKQVEWTAVDDLLNIMDKTKLKDYIRSLIPFYAQVYRLYDFHFETFENMDIIENSINIRRNEIDGIMTFNTTVGKAVFETRNLSLNRQFKKVFISNAPTYSFVNIFYSIDDGITWTLVPNAPIEFNSPRDSLKLKFEVPKADETPLEIDFYGFFAVFSLEV